MSKQYPGGIISKTAPVPSGALQNSTAPGIWTLEQQAYWQKLGQWPTQGNVDPSLFIENLFSTYLYTGNSSTQTITNGIDITGKGGLVWIKNRTNGTTYHILTDTVRGAGLNLSSNVAIPQYNDGQPTFNSTGFNLINSNIDYNTSANNYVSWTFREQPKFFDIVTYTGNQAVGRAISHSLGSTPGCVIVKCTTETRSWFVYHRSIGATKHLILNDTGAEITQTDIWNNTTPTSTTFTVGDSSNVNGNGRTYVAYLWAHDAGGFGASGTDNVISCGSYTGNSSADGPIVTLGYEPQWVMIKNTTTAGYSWSIYDNMRGVPTGPNDVYLLANTTDADQGATSGTNEIDFQATGFQLKSASFRYNASGDTFIYIAIRRGPMKVPTVGTSVFNPSFNGQTSTDYLAYLGQPTDFWIRNDRAGSDHNARSRLTGGGYLLTNSTAAEGTQAINWWDNQFGVGEVGTTYGYSTGIVNYLFRRAPGFFDVVCYTGTGANRTVAHNLTVVPELMIVKRRSATEDWAVYSAPVGNTSRVELNTTSALTTSINNWNDTSPTASVFTVGVSIIVNGSGNTYVAYLFATCPGVSKVGGYTGTGTTLQIDCGFTAGARFVLIKRTDSTGDWYVWDSARGIVAGNDPYLLINSTAAEVTNTDYVDTYSAGFEITSTAPAAINANGGTYIFLAIA
jgi:hypothetical protein